MRSVNVIFKSLWSLSSCMVIILHIIIFVLSGIFKEASKLEILYASDII